MSLEIVCREVKNWFEQDKIFDTFTIEDGVIQFPRDAKIPLNGQYIRIVGSVFNDGVYTFPVSDLTDETFEGAVWLLAIPKDFKDLVAEIDAWQTKFADVTNSPYQSESFGGYSYSKSVSGTGADKSTWQGAFASRLNRWRKI